MDDWTQNFIDYLTELYQTEEYTSSDTEGYGPVGDWAPEWEQLNPYTSQVTTPYQMMNPVWEGWGTEEHMMEMPMYSYGGMSGDVMGALGNVLSLPAAGMTGWQMDEEYLPAVGQNWDPVYGALPGYDDPNLTYHLGWEGYGDQMESLLPMTNVFDPESLAQAFTNLTGTYGDPITAAEVKALTPEMLEKTEGAYYEPYEISKREGLISKKTKDIGEVETGGFAGSGARTGGVSTAQDLYTGGYTNILADIMKMKGSAESDVLDTIYGWQELMG